MENLSFKHIERNIINNNMKGKLKWTGHINKIDGKKYWWNGLKIKSFKYLPTAYTRQELYKDGSIVSSYFKSEPQSKKYRKKYGTLITTEHYNGGFCRKEYYRKPPKSDSFELTKVEVFEANNPFNKKYYRSGAVVSSNQYKKGKCVSSVIYLDGYLNNKNRINMSNL